jgi:hypothetical protein
MKTDPSALTILPTGRPKNKRRPRQPKLKLPAWRRWIDTALAWVSSNHLNRSPRRLRLCETISLGEKRFAAVVEFDDRRFLIGGAATSISLLAELSQPTFASALASKNSVVPETK